LGTKTISKAVFPLAKSAKLLEVMRACYHEQFCKKNFANVNTALFIVLFAQGVKVRKGL
jgi:hypothetical protein